MDRWATKDTYEHEADEAERLVRPAPKVKPPRHDKKRETVNERDSDTSSDPDLKGDPDMSLNYKSVGGSLVERVAARFAAEKDDKPKSNQWVRVRNRQLDVGTRVKPETLKEKPGVYEKTPENEPRDIPEGKPRPARKPRRPHYHKDPIPHPKWLDPRPMPPKPPRPARPPKPVKPVPVRRYPEPEKPPKVKPPGWVPERRKPASMVVSSMDEDILAGVLPEENPDKPVLAEPQPELPPAPSVPKPKRRKASPAEQRVMRDALEKAGLDPEVWDIHPEDFQRIRASAAKHAQVKIPVNKLDDHVENLKGRGLFQLNPAKIAPPKRARTSTGELVAFDTLPEDEQQEAWAQYRNEVLAVSLALQSQAKEAYRSMGMPPALARILMQAKLLNHKPDVFEVVVSGGERDDLSPKQRLRALSKLKSPSDAALAAKFFQGQDYLDARAKFLNPDSEFAITEYSSPSEVKQALEMASAMLDERSSAYPEDLADPALSSAFRAKLVMRLHALSPEKAVVIQKLVDDMDAEAYEQARDVWEKACADARKLIQQREKQREKIRKQFDSGKFTSDEASPTLEECWAKDDLLPSDDPPLPKPPTKPARYDLTHGTIPKAKNQYDDLFALSEEEDPAPKQVKTASGQSRLVGRVVGRFLAFSLV